MTKQEKSDDNGANVDPGAINVEQKSANVELGAINVEQKSANVEPGAISVEQKIAGLFVQCLADEHKIRSNHVVWTNDCFHTMPPPSGDEAQRSLRDWGRAIPG